MSHPDEFDEVAEWAWSEGIDAIDAKDDEYSEASAHVEMFLVLGSVLEMHGWTRDELIKLLDEVSFEGGAPAEKLH
jgi:hypothetical protein